MRDMNEKDARAVLESIIENEGFRYREAVRWALSRIKELEEIEESLYYDLAEVGEY